ncbi:hypothetical protein PFISCL1PPCAC_24921 [Pristionchus fissidentatus]|uniref:E3 ubiquitin-protein ligase UBR5 n=1 Tax=Pristionchus fissidentatus TaxID=1538716 RepID=A0AAV5WVI6_9BILA|nr:hypothetical protein PFISCL1PPCAC_24921 [Pristionchus fissidentatus]
MDEQRQLLFVNQFIPSNEQKLIDRLREAASRRITRPVEVTHALRDVPIDTITDLVVGPSYVGVLFTDGQIGRFPYVATTRPLVPSASPTKNIPAAAPTVSGTGGSGGGGGGPGGGPSGGPGGSGGTSAHPSLIARTAKFRRVMLATSGRRDHRSVIIDRARPMLPASAVPEDLIAQAQVVLQGKTREVIIRELQRTNLNVNEAVNNLLSRDDDDDDGSEGAEMCIPEELLSLLDSSHGGSILESELYGGDTFEYLMSSRDRRSKNEKDKEKQKSSKPNIETNSDTEALRRYEIPSGSMSEPWEGFDCKEAAKYGGRRFTRIACTQSELLAISTNGELYGWKWTEESGENAVHIMHEKLKLEDGEMLTHLSASSLRVAVMTSTGRMATWLDNVSCGERLCEALFVPPQKLAVTCPESIDQLVVSNQLAVATFPSNLFFWCGFYPVNERRRIFEKARSRLRKHVTFDTTQIVEGSEVRTKSGPIYSIGCIAANLAGPTPMIGILMENAWSLSEMCRFRLLDPTAYDTDRYMEGITVEEEESREGSKETAIAQQALTSGSRKRPAADEVFSSGSETTKQREEPWLISDVIFIHEEVQNDTAIVRIVDGGYCAVEYQKVTSCPSDAFATPASKKLARSGDKEKPQPKMRLIRKDELTVVTQKMRYARSPNSVRVEPCRFVLSGSTSTKKVISAVADSLGIRALVERRGTASIMRISVSGKILTSHPLPLHAPSLYSTDGSGKPKLMNYGDDGILVLRDAHGGIIPLVRDASAGFREPTYLQLPAASVTALAVKNVGEKDRTSWAPKATREAIILSLLGAHPRTVERRLPSLLYTVMSCDEKAVKAILDELQKEDDANVSRHEVVESKTDGNRNGLHAAVMGAFATKNAIEADVDSPLSVLTTTESRSAAEQARMTLDKKWNEMLKTRSSNRAAASASTASTSSATSTAAVSSSNDALNTASTQSDAPMEIEIVPESQVPSVVIKIEVDDENALIVSPVPVENPKQRQEASIAIVKMLVTHPVCMPFMAEMLSARDIHGQTPFMAAVNNRAYSAARAIFGAVIALVESETGKIENADQLIPFIFPVGCRPDDSPLFILCYNDTCSFTWTGDEHINQDIFECRTCGLTGSLCCCTECAFTCHRNHDCKLKRTSPTAYCDCWEKACCKALVNGNQYAREQLLMGLVTKSNLYTMLNGRGEHVLLYLARKLSRQSSEQWNYTRRPRRIQPPSARGDTNIPEHDLDPPKFARTALLYGLRNWNVVKSLAMIGVRRIDKEVPISEELFHLNSQNGSSHLDKFMLILLTKCTDESNVVLETLLKVLTETHNKERESGDNLEEVNIVISRFVRSVARLFILAVIISSVAASTAVSGILPTKDSSTSGVVDRSALRGISFSGIFGHLRKDTSKDSKLKNMGTFIMRCKMFFEHFALFTLHEMSQLADASLAPVRTGIVRPCVSLPVLLGASADSIESLEKYINSEPDVTQTLYKMELEMMDHSEDRRETRKRRKRTSRRDTDREEATSEGLGGGGGGGGGGSTSAPLPPTQPPVERESSAESDISDSDSDGDGPSSRRHASQSSALAANEEPASNEQTTTRPQPDEEYSSDGEDEEESESEGDGRDDEEDDEEEEEEEEMERDEPIGEEDAEMDYVTSEGEAPTSTGVDEMRLEAVEREESNAVDGEAERERRREERRADAVARAGEEEGSGRLSASSPDDEMEAFEDFVIDSAERSRSPSSPEYSSGEEGVEDRPSRRHRRRKSAAAAAAAAAGAADGGVDGGAGGEGGRERMGAAGEQPVQIRDGFGVRQGDRNAADASRGNVAQAVAYDEIDVSSRRDEERSEARSGEGDGSARTRPEDPRRPATSTGRNDGPPPPSATINVDSRNIARRTVDGARRLMWSGDRMSGGRRNATGDASRPRAGSSSTGNWSGVYSSRRGELPQWISRSSDIERRARGNVGSSAIGSASEEKKTDVGSAKEDEVPTTVKASIQLATAFSFAVRIIGEMLPLVAADSSAAAPVSAVDTTSTPASSRMAALRDVEQLSEMEETVRRRAFELVCTRLEDSWKWLAIVLDHVEAQIKYINAVSATENTRKKEGKERKKSGMKKKSSSNVGDDSSAPVTSSPLSSTSPLSLSKVKRETMSCLLGVLRAHSGEAGDDTPLIHLETLRAPALVVDAYLGFIEAKADTEKLFERSKKKDESSLIVESTPDVEEEIMGVRGFYQRSNSVSFPGVSFSDAHDTLQLPCMQALPIVERPQLLTSTVEKEVLFGPSSSTQERTKDEHDKVIRSHGIAHSHNQSLTTAPISSHRLFCVDEEDLDEQPTVVVPLSSVASAPAALNDMVDETKEKKTPAKGKRGKKRGRTGDIKKSPSTDVIVDEEDDCVVVVQPPQGFEKVTYEEILDSFNIFREHPLRKLMGRWRYVLQLIAKELHADLTDTLGGDLSGSRLLRELAGFEMKQHELRARMEKYRAGATKDVAIEVNRDPAALIRETCYQLNRTFTRRVAMRGTENRSSGLANNKKDESLPPLASHKVKVKFRDEPGEGTGVARSYYTALAEALVSLKQLPFTDYGYNSTNDEYLYGGSMNSGPPTAPSGGSASNSARRIQLIRGRESFYATVTSATSSGGRRKVSPYDRRLALNYLHPPYTPTDMAAAEALNVSSEYLLDLREEMYSRQREGSEKLPVDLSDRLFILIRNIYPAAASRLTGMFMDLPIAHILLILADPPTLKAYLGDAIDQMMTNAAPTDIVLLRGEKENSDLASTIITSTEADDAPLFFRPSKKAHYSPVPGRLSPARISAFRNIGRVMGLCLMQCEMFPLRLSRHVLKYILGRPLNWHDFAFYDPQMFESLRKLIVDGCSTPDHHQFFDDLQMTFSTQPPPESTGVPSTTIDLIPNGSEILVTKDNVIEYVYRFVETRLLGSSNGRCLAAMRQGVQDVIPQSLLDNLNAEDLRLVLCGTETVSLSLMQSYTAWTDESHAVPETIEKYKQWFWQVADRLSPQEKQDLIFFWTGAPSLPSTEEGFQPLPTIVIRPSDDGFLPTANTCISRLYLPLYNSKRILAAKLQLAIKAKNFGFV